MTSSPAYPYDPPREPFLQLVWEDRDILVFDKPSGLLTVAGRPPGLDDCLEARAEQRFPGARIVHRLDKDTSGLIVLGRNPEAHRRLSMDFEARRVEKAYVARVWGDLQPDKGRVDAPLRTDWPNRPKQEIHPEGRPAITDWQVLGREPGATRVALTPLTGRSHQLRVHMLSLGHPILGDEFYAPPEALAAADRLQLHASMLAFAHPRSGAPLRFESPAPF